MALLDLSCSGDRALSYDVCQTNLPEQFWHVQNLYHGRGNYDVLLRSFSSAWDAYVPNQRWAAKEPTPASYRQIVLYPLYNYKSIHSIGDGCCFGMSQGRSVLRLALAEYCAAKHSRNCSVPQIVAHAS